MSEKELKEKIEEIKKAIEEKIEKLKIQKAKEEKIKKEKDKIISDIQKLKEKMGRVLLPKKQ